MVLIASILTVFFAYIFFLQKAIINVVEREKLSKQTSEVVISVSDLETKYFSMKNAITLSLAHSKGLKDAEVVSYISKKSLTAMAPSHEL